MPKISNIKRVKSPEVIEGLVRELLEVNPEANIVMAGPSTLNLDHSIVYFSDIAD